MKMLQAGLLFLVMGSCAMAQERVITVLADKTPALELTVPAGAKITPSKNKTVIQTSEMFLHVWPVSGAKSLADVQARLGDVIAGDVLKFAPSTTNTLTVAGAPAVHLIGKGVEADDGDDATADVVIFSAGSRLFVACVHGEGNDASRERKPMLELLKTAKKPNL